MAIQTVESWYQPKLELTKEQEAYIKLVTELFNMRTQAGTPIPYRPTPYQVEFHAESLNVKKESAKDILFIKARGVSFTMTTAIELIMSANYYRGAVFPIVAQRWQSAKGIVDVCKWLIENANYNLKESVEVLETEIRFKDTGSIIRPYPSASASDALRSLRLVRVMLDEYAFQQRDKDLLAAAQDTMQGKLGQIIIGSTPCGINNHFYELVKEPVGFKVFRLPVFPEDKFDRNTNILEQNLKPIAPWIDLDRLETKRRRDVEIFMQEQMCSFLDDSISYLPFSLIKRCENAGLVNYLNVVEDTPDFVYDSNNPMYMGIDVARTHDLSAITIFEKVYLAEEQRYVMVQRLILFLQNKPLPQQQEIVSRLLKQFPQIVRVRVDMTGLGLGLYEHLRRQHGAKIEGVNFAERVKADGKHTTPIKERMAINMKNLMQSDPPAVNFIVNDLQEKHLNSVDYNFQAVRRVGEGHGDMFWADALALLPENYRAPATTPLVASVKYQPPQQGVPIIEKEQHFEDVKKTFQMTWDEKLKYLRKTGRAIR